MVLQKKRCVLREVNTKCILLNTQGLKVLSRLMEDVLQSIGKRRYRSFPISIACISNDYSKEAK